MDLRCDAQFFFRGSSEVVKAWLAENAIPALVGEAGDSWHMVSVLLGQAD